jgi:hypothetical protein
VRYLKSHNRHHELHFPPIGNLPGITLPRDFYLSHEVAAGKRSVVAVSPPQEQRLLADEEFKTRLRAGEYEWVDAMPDEVKTDAERLAEARTEIRRLKKLAGEEGESEPEPEPEGESEDEEEGEKPDLIVNPNIDQTKGQRPKKKG